jgi:hypothetical protein
MLSTTLRGAHLHRSSMQLLVKPRRDWPESELMRHTDVPCGSRRRSAASESRRYPRRDAVRCLPPERLGVDCVSRARAGRFLSPSPRSTPPRRAVPPDPPRRRPSSARINRSSSADHIAMQRSPANDGQAIKLARHARWHCALPNRGRHPTESPTYPLLFPRRDATAMTWHYVAAIDTVREPRSVVASSLSSTIPTCAEVATYPFRPRDRAIGGNRRRDLAPSRRTHDLVTDPLLSHQLERRAQVVSLAEHYLTNRGSLTWKVGSSQSRPPAIA